MRILNRYLFKNLMKPLVYLIVAFALLFIVGDLMNNASKFLEAGTGLSEMAYYYVVLFLPSMVIMIVPLCLLLAVLYSLSTLTRHSEIIAMRASGISIYRIVRPYLLVSIGCLLLTAGVNEYFGPKFAYLANQFVEYQEDPEDNSYREAIFFRNPTEGHIWRIEQFDTRDFTMRGITLTVQRKDGSNLAEYTASQARWMDRHWWFDDGTIQKYDEQGNRSGNPEPLEPDPTEMRKLTETPENFMIEIKDPRYQSSLELWDYIQTHNTLLSPETLTQYEVDFHHRLSMPFICIVITLIGIPVGAHTGRKGAFAGIMLALAMFFGFYAMQFTMEYLAKQMYIIPWVGAWGAIIAFFVIGSVMIHRMR